MRKYCLILCTILFILPGCGRIVDWSMDPFYQGEKWDNPKYIVRSYLRDLNLYFELETWGLFRALWLNDAVRCSYAYLYNKKCAKTEQEAATFVEQELNENKKHISFYVMAWMPGGWELNDRKGYDMLYLEVNGKKYFPLMIEPAELNAEYHMFLERVFDKRRKLYMVKFNAQVDGQPIITPDTEEIKLVVHSLDRKGAMTWSLDPLPLVPYPHRCLPSELAISRKEGVYENSNWI